MGDRPGQSSYILGHADFEVRRLMLQARLYRDCTEHALQVAGLEAGMRVLDVGCGPGDVSFLAAQLVGPTGRVVGVDAAAEVIDVARRRSVEAGLATVSFRQSTLAELVLDEPVDAVIGRLILMHVPDPVATLRRLATLVRPGGVIAFCENDLTAIKIVPERPLVRALSDAITAAFRAADLNPAFGATLYELFQRAGLGVPRLTLGAPIGGAENADLLAYGIEVWRLMLPIATAAGLGTEDLADPDLFLPQLHKEIADSRCVVTGPPLITASTRLPVDV